jgi:hypothetical protein
MLFMLASSNALYACQFTFISPVHVTALEQSQAIQSELQNNVDGPVDPTQLMVVAKRLGDLPAEA